MWLKFKLYSKVTFLTFLERTWPHFQVLFNHKYNSGKNLQLWNGSIIKFVIHKKCIRHHIMRIMLRILANHILANKIHSNYRLDTISGYRTILLTSKCIQLIFTKKHFYKFNVQRMINWITKVISPQDLLLDRIYNLISIIIQFISLQRNFFLYPPFIYWNGKMAKFCYLKKDEDTFSLYQRLKRFVFSWNSGVYIPIFAWIGISI